jgi:hypothetical protein
MALVYISKQSFDVRIDGSRDVHSLINLGGYGLTNFPNEGIFPRGKNGLCFKKMHTASFRRSVESDEARELISGEGLLSADLIDIASFGHQFPLVKPKSGIISALSFSMILEKLGKLCCPCIARIQEKTGFIMERMDLPWDPWVQFLCVEP